VGASWYFAGRYSRKSELRGYAEALRRETGADCTARWLYDEELDEETCGERDLYDVERATGLILFVEPFGTHTHHGRLTEFGAAAAFGLRLLAVGENKFENVFLRIKSVEHFLNWQEALTKLKNENESLRGVWGPGTIKQRVSHG
jgi:hypothetical protein